jgi:hypothetical protein
MIKTVAMIKSIAFLLLVAIIVMLMVACYFFERTTDVNHLARSRKKKSHPRRIDEYLSSIGDKKINELLVAKHHEPIHPNLFWLLLIPACLFASPALAQGTISHSSIFSHPGIIILFILIMLAGMVKRPISIQSPINEKK